jgi:hypothetical protein
MWPKVTVADFNSKVSVRIIAKPPELSTPAMNFARSHTAGRCKERRLVKKHTRMA